MTRHSRRTRESEAPDCIRYERLERKWERLLPATREVEFYLGHGRSCPAGIHRPERWTRMLGETRRWLEEERGLLARADRDGGIDVASLLAAAGAVERDWDYRLPCGLHSDTHVNLGRLCRSEELLDGVGVACGIALNHSKVEFDTVVSTGGPMSMVARRMLRLTSSRGPIDHVPSHGYERLTFLRDIRPGARVVLLLDVVVTGTLISRLSAEIGRREGVVVKVLTLVDAGLRPVRERFEALCAVAMDLVDPARKACPRCLAGMERAEFNTMAFKMTRRSRSPRSPSEFLARNPDAQEFWRLVDMAGAYAPHVLKDRRHYVAFVDTLRLLTHPVAGPCVFTGLREQILKGPGIPDVLLAPGRRRRSRVLAEGLQASLACGRVGIVLASGVRGHYRLPRHAESLAGRRVIVVDAAVGHGDVLDELTLLATDAGAARVGAAVVLSRLSETEEDALRHRLPAGFTRLFSLPIPPLEGACPECQRRAVAATAAAQLPPGPAQRLADRIARPRGHVRRPQAVGQPPGPEQIWLFPVPPHFGNCRPGVASGKVLNALHAAMGDGMAPLTLPELSAGSVPNTHRVAILDHLAAGVLDWSGPELTQELERVLDTTLLQTPCSPVAGAVVELLAREGRLSWLDRLEEALEGASALPPRRALDARFVARSVFALFRLRAERPELAREATLRLLRLRDRYGTMPAGAPLLEVMAGLDGVLLAETPLA
jgi:orotate phosphoribosyltransferase